MTPSADLRARAALPSFMAHPLAWLLALAALHVLARLLLSPAPKWDEAEQVLWSQRLALGYGAQPPLYTWLQWGMNQLLGVGVLSLAVLKHALLVLTYVAMWLAGRELLGPRGAWWAAASMVLLPPLGWDSVRDQTHSVLVTAMACAAWWLLLRTVRQPRPRHFALLGLVCGLGLLAKYSFALLAGALLLAALSVPEARRALRSRGWWWAPLVALLVVLPHASWLAAHLGEASAGTLQKMQLQPGAGLAKGLRALLVDGLASTLALWVALALAAFGAAWWRRPLTPAAPWAHRLFLRYLALVLLALLALVLFGGVTSFRGRWVLPLLCMLPLAAFAARPELQQHPGGARFTAAVVAVTLAILLVAGLRPWVTSFRGHTDELNHPAVELAAALRQAGYDGRSPVIAADHMMAGMLRLRFPAAPVAACPPEAGAVAACVARLAAQAQRAGQGWLLISRADRLDPGWWTQARAGLAPPVAAEAVQSLALPFHMVPDGAPPARYQYLWHPAQARP